MKENKSTGKKQGGKRERWLDNLKLIACVAVFWGHFYSSFYGQLQNPSFLSRLDNVFIFVTQKVLNILFNGGWWVFVFCIISGCLAWQKEIESFSELIKTLIHRYIRFVIPVFFANAFVFFIGRTIGFHAFEVGSVINNQWLAANYSNAPQAGHVLLSALLLTNEFIGPLWVLKYIFIGTCVIYCLKYLLCVFKIDNDNSESAFLVILNGWLLFYVALHNYVVSWFYVIATVGGGLLSFSS